MIFKFRIKDLELRSVGKHLILSNEHDRAEIVKWDTNKDGEEFCYTIAYWTKGKEGYDLGFVGDRPFKEDAETFMTIAEKGNILLDKHFENNNKN